MIDRSEVREVPEETRLDQKSSRLPALPWLHSLRQKLAVLKENLSEHIERRESQWLTKRYKAQEVRAEASMARMRGNLYQGSWLDFWRDDYVFPPHEGFWTYREYTLGNNIRELGSGIRRLLLFLGHDLPLRTLYDYLPQMFLYDPLEHPRYSTHLALSEVLKEPQSEE